MWKFQKHVGTYLNLLELDLCTIWNAMQSSLQISNTTIPDRQFTNNIKSMKHWSIYKYLTCQLWNSQTTFFAFACCLHCWYHYWWRSSRILSSESVVFNAFLNTLVFKLHCYNFSKYCVIQITSPKYFIHLLCVINIIFPFESHLHFNAFSVLNETIKP